MNLAIHVERLREQLTAAADVGGPESRAAVDRLSAGLESATRLVLLETLSAAADEITAELAPGAVEVRLRGSDPAFVVTLPSGSAHQAGDEGGTPSAGAIPQGGDEGGTSRLNLRLPDALKARIEEAARREGLSLNAWLVRAAAAAAERPPGQTPRTPGGQRYTGWVH